MKHSTEPSTGGDIDARIREAEHAVIASDAHFRNGVDDLGAALRGHAGRVIAASVTGVAVAVLGWLLFRTRAARRDATAPGRGAPARPIPLQRHGAAAVLGDVLGSAARIVAAPRPSGVLPLLLTSVVPLVARVWQHRANPRRHAALARDR